MTATDYEDMDTSSDSTLAQEPVTIGGAVLGLGNAILGALPLFGVGISAAQVGALNLVLVALVVLVTVLQRHYSVARANVVEQKIGSEIVAGEANEFVKTGDIIRPVGVLETHAEDHEIP